MVHTKEEIRKIQKHMAIISFKHLKIVNTRTLTIFHKNKIFESLDINVKYEDILPIVINKEHPSRVPTASGPLLFYLAQEELPQANLTNLAELLFATNIDIRKSVFDYFNRYSSS